MTTSSRSKETKYRIDPELYDKLVELNLGSPNKAIRYFLGKEEAGLDPVNVALEKSQIEALTQLLNSFKPATHKTQLAFMLEAGSHFKAAFIQAEENRIVVTRSHNQIQNLVEIINQQTAALSKMDHVLNAVLSFNATRENTLTASYDEFRKHVQEDLLENRQHLCAAIESLYKVPPAQNTKH